MLTLLLRIYYALPQFMHCTATCHRLPCLAMSPIFRIFMDEKPCPRRDLLRPPFGR